MLFSQSMDGIKTLRNAYVAFWQVLGMPFPV